MLTKPIFGYAKPRFNYELLSTRLPEPVPMGMPATVTLLLPREMGPAPSPKLKPGTDGVQGGKGAFPSSLD